MTPQQAFRLPHFAQRRQQGQALIYGIFVLMGGLAALLFGIGKSFTDQFSNNMSSAYKMNELAVIMVVAIILLAFLNKVPAMGGGTGALGSGFGAGRRERIFQGEH